MIEYSPDVFAFLRQRDGFSNEILMKSLDPEKNKQSVFKAGESQGKSGSFFFFSQDQNFIIKTMTESDFQAFQRIQKAYFDRVNNDPNCLLGRIYGIYSVIQEDKAPVKLVVMGNCMKNAKMHQGVFDLKGSLVARLTKGPILSKSQILKDRNILALNKQKEWLNFRPRDREQIWNAMISDVEMLWKFNLMDYSLLLCIQDNPDYKTIETKYAEQAKYRGNRKRVMLAELREKFEKDNNLQERRHKFLSKNGKFIYHVGIIDYLQDYSLGKQLENLWKQHIMMAGKMISAVNPYDYALRFLDFMRKNVIIDQEARTGTRS